MRRGDRALPRRAVSLKQSSRRRAGLRAYSRARCNHRPRGMRLGGVLYRHIRCRNSAYRRSPWHRADLPLPLQRSAPRHTPTVQEEKRQDPRRSSEPCARGRSGASAQSLRAGRTSCSSRTQPPTRRFRACGLYDMRGRYGTDYIRQRCLRCSSDSLLFRFSTIRQGNSARTA